MYYLSAACIAKNEDPYLEEWVNFHRAVGVEHLYIYDNDSTTPIKQLLSKYIEAGIVEVIDFPGKLKHMPAFQHCLQNFGHLSKWIAFIDCDEFIVPKSKDSVPEILAEFEQYGGLAVNWLIFGSDGHIAKPNGLVIENFVMSSHKNWCLNNHNKSIVQPAKTKGTGDTHWFAYNSPFFAVTQDHTKIQNLLTNLNGAKVKDENGIQHNAWIEGQGFTIPSVLNAQGASIEQKSDLNVAKENIQTMGDLVMYVHDKTKEGVKILWSDVVDVLERV